MKNKRTHWLAIGWHNNGTHISMFVSLLMMTKMMMIYESKDENYHDDVDVDVERDEHN